MCVCVCVCACVSVCVSNLFPFIFFFFVFLLVICYSALYYWHSNCYFNFGAAAAIAMICAVLCSITHYSRVPLFPTFEFASVRASSPNAPGAIAIKLSFRGESLPTFSTLLC